MLVVGNVGGKTVVFDIPDDALKKYPSFEIIAHPEEYGTKEDYSVTCKGVYSKTC